MLVTDYQINPEHFFEREGCVYKHERCDEANMDLVTLHVDTTLPKYDGMTPNDGKYCVFLDHAKLKRPGFFLTCSSDMLSMDIGHANYKVDKDYEYGNLNIKTGEIYKWDQRMSDCPWEHWKYIRTGYGVADNISQVYRKYRKVLNNPDYHVMVLINQVRKCDQPSSGGWRWHKWGDYIGYQKPQCEYLFNEPKIDQVILFNIIVVKKVE